MLSRILSKKGLAMSRDLSYVLTDEQAAEIWSSLIGNFVAPMYWDGDSSLRVFILASMEITGEDGIQQNYDDKAGGLSRFLRRLDYCFHIGIRYLEKSKYGEIISMWSAIAEDPLFDPDHTEWIDKPYYRCQVGSGICQLLISEMNSERTDLNGWVVRVIGYISRVVKLQLVDPEKPGYFYGNRDAAGAQNYNLAMTLDAAVRWFGIWSPKTVSWLSDISETTILDLQAAVNHRAYEMTKYLGA
jgi:hypothetical protein